MDFAVVLARDPCDCLSDKLCKHTWDNTNQSLVCHRRPCTCERRELLAPRSLLSLARLANSPSAQSFKDGVTDVHELAITARGEQCSSLIYYI